MKTIYMSQTITAMSLIQRKETEQLIASGQIKIIEGIEPYLVIEE